MMSAAKDRQRADPLGSGGAGGGGEIMKNEKYREDIKIKSREFSEKEKLLQAGESQERLAAPPGSTLVRGHASAQLYGKSEPSEDPTSTGRDFQPGSWRPRGGED